jgi:hypothetical protein
MRVLESGAGVAQAPRPSPVCPRDQHPAGEHVAGQHGNRGGHQAMVETGQVEQDERNYRHNEHHRAGE